MNIEQIEGFLSIVKHHTFSEAAEQLHISQSSLSKKIISLEEELGTEVFSRKKRQVTLTEAGNVIYQDAYNLLLLYQNIKRKAEYYSSKTENIISLSILPILNQYGLIEQLYHFQSQHPEIVLKINELEEPDISKGFSEEKISLAIVREEFLDNLSGSFERKEIAYDEFVLLVSSKHPFATRTDISFEELQTESFILMNQYTSVYTTFIKLCSSYGFKPRILHTARLETISSSVAINQGISFLPLKSAELFHAPETVICHFNTKITSTIVLAKSQKRNLSKAESYFFHEFMRDL